ncbi:hypothetical protein N431DRAFT_431176, partial [Stipitochalara longipes BDJ]
MHIYPTFRLALSTCTYLNPGLSDPQVVASDIHSSGIVVSVGRNSLQLELNHVRTVGCQDVEAVGLRKSGFNERLRFLLNAIQGKQSGVDDLLNDF